MHVWPLPTHNHNHQLPLGWISIKVHLIEIYVNCLDVKFCVMIYGLEYRGLLNARVYFTYTRVLCDRGKKVETGSCHLASYTWMGLKVVKELFCVRTLAVLKACLLLPRSRPVSLRFLDRCLGCGRFYEVVIFLGSSSSTVMPFGGNAFQLYIHAKLFLTCTWASDLSASLQAPSYVFT